MKIIYLCKEAFEHGAVEYQTDNNIPVEKLIEKVDTQKLIELIKRTEDIYTDELNHNPIIAKWISTSKRILKIREFVINQSWQEVEKMCVQIENEEYQNLPCVGKEVKNAKNFANDRIAYNRLEGCIIQTWMTSYLEGLSKKKFFKL